MRTDSEVLRDIKSAPFRDLNGRQILPGQYIIIDTEEPILAVTKIKDGEFMVGGISLDEVLENYNVVVMGWIQ